MCACSHFGGNSLVVVVLRVTPAERVQTCGCVEKDVLEAEDRVDMVSDSLDERTGEKEEREGADEVQRDQRKKSDRNVFRPLIRRDEE